MRPGETDRERLIRFIQPWVDARPTQYTPRIGYAGLGYTLSLDDLTDVALDKLAVRIVGAFWWDRKNNRENRRIYAERRQA